MCTNYDAGKWSSTVGAKSETSQCEPGKRNQPLVNTVIAFGVGLCLKFDLDLQKIYMLSYNQPKMQNHIYFGRCHIFKSIKAHLKLFCTPINTSKQKTKKFDETVIHHGK